MTKWNKMCENIKNNAERLKLSPKDVGGFIGCSEEQIENFYKGNSFISFSQLQTLAEKFNVPISELLPPLTETSKGF